MPTIHKTNVKRIYFTIGLYLLQGAIDLLSFKHKIPKEFTLLS